MKLLSLAFFSLSLLIASCKKDKPADSHFEDQVLTGVWVEKNFHNDTLVVYRSNGKNLMLDNSPQYRQSLISGFPAASFFNHQYILKKDTIGLRPSTSTGPYFYYSFQWISYNKEFRMLYNGLRPHLSSIGYSTYVRVN